jgi:flagellar biosynthesis/type III secretory pathway protein FliH
MQKMSKMNALYQEEAEPNYEAYQDYLEQERNEAFQEGAASFKEEVRRTLSSEWLVLPKELQDGFEHAANLIERLAI